MKKESERKIIDADTNKIIGYFDVENTEQTLKTLKSYEKWNDISVDIDGDIILWKD